MQRRLPRIIRVRFANGISTTTRRSKITFTNVAHEGSRNSVENATEACFAIVATNSSSESLKKDSRFRLSNYSPSW